MASSPTEVQGRFRAAFTPEVLNGLAKCVWAGYQECQAICGTHFMRDQMHDVRGHIRRGLIERNWSNYARRVPGAVALQQSNSVGSVRYVVIEIDGVMLTQSLADGPNELLQQANFRDHFAESSQLTIPGLGPASPRRASGKLYGTFLHGPTLDNYKQPRFMSVAFPTYDGTAYLTSIDVFAELGDLAKAIRADRVEDIGDDLMLELRRLDEDEATETA